jgi:hypothetical protein
MILKIRFPGLIPYAVRTRWQRRKSDPGRRTYIGDAPAAVQAKAKAEPKAQPKAKPPRPNQPLTVGPTREIVTRTITRRSRSMPAR